MKICNITDMNLVPGILHNYVLTNILAVISMYIPLEPTPIKACMHNVSTAC